MAMDFAQTELLCPQCGGQCFYSPEYRNLECFQCGESSQIDVPDGHTASAERNYDGDGDGDDRVTLRTHTHHCETCGGDVIFTGPTLSNRCAYCDGPVVRRPGDDGYQTMALIPFHVTEAVARENALAWVAGRLAAPDDLPDVVAGGRIAAIYAPFWTFDSQEAISYWAKYKAKSGKNTVTRSTSGTMKTSFDDMLVPASPHVTPLIRDGILHEFDPEALRPFLPGFLAGFAAEQHHQSVTEGLRAAADDKDLLIRNRIKTRINKRGVHDIRYKTDTTGIRYRRILLPVWILHYAYDGKPMKVVVCGIHGRTFGERPFSRLKLIGYSAALSAAAILIGLVWGGLAAS